MTIAAFVIAVLSMLLSLHSLAFMHTVRHYRRTVELWRMTDEYLGFDNVPTLHRGLVVRYVDWFLPHTYRIEQRLRDRLSSLRQGSHK